ncbi:uncharacterized protein LOC122388524 [Amphibalanus amphitrite]|uniref:uncharacterized protein LOC122367930 n=1 Tax=Amphibalanus amphitrite TaxID=1232801 RepID=UPI001C90D79D|nr:uncharacterized protein LOC122367930 [Amphibalanus amphitrite]XP_043234125.1 uncharacterized protein LOC122387727 [Amphibalanus amphitrite]XP_043235682.1 uncharacterized protein LOC122388524 [Amphibalanus amphitrite]
MAGTRRALRSTKKTHHLFGIKPANLPKNQLPTCRDIVARILYLRSDERNERGVAESCVAMSPLLAQVGDECLDIWRRASLPTLARFRVVKKVHTLWKTKDMVRKHGARKGKLVTAKPAEMSRLFDIRSGSQKPVSKEDLKFLEDQRTKRRLYIGPVDWTATIARRRSEARRAAEARLLQRGRDTAGPSRGPDHQNAAVAVADHTAGRCKRAAAVAATAVIAAGDRRTGEEASSADCSSEDSDDSYQPPRKATQQGSQPLRATAEALDASHVGARKGSKILTALKEDLGLLGFQNSGLVTKRKVQNSLDKCREDKLQGLAADTAACTALFCDGRQDKELSPGGSRTVGNVTINMHPGDIHIGHFSCEPGERHSGEVYANKLLAFLAERGVSCERLTAFGGDGANQVTGWKMGQMACFERLLGRPLQRLVCLCHHAELPFRALFQHLDGKTTGPSTFSGPIGRQIAGDVQKLAIKSFPRLACPDFPSLPPAVVHSLSSDLRLLYETARAVVTEDDVPPRVAAAAHGKLYAARWHTAQSRLLRHYMAQERPGDALAALAVYVCCVYVPTVMAIKHKSDAVHAAPHLHAELRRQERYCRPEDLPVLRASVRRNAFMAHEENVLLAMLGDADPTVRTEAVGVIKRIRATRESPVPGLVRPFRVPGSVGATTALNDSAATYWSLVDLDRATLEPPLTQGMTGDQLEKFLETPLLTGLPCHTQSTERAVKVTTEAAGQVRGARRQDGHALNKLAWRRRNPGQVVKKKYRPVKTTAEKEG